MSRTLLFKGARVIDATAGADAIGDVYVRDGVLSRKRIEDERADAVYDCRGLVLCPALVDLHCHLREPGGERKETVASGTAAAAAGGFGSVCAMPNTRPAYDSVQNAEMAETQHSEGARVHVYRIAAVTEGRAGKKLVDIDALAEHGVVGFSDDGDYLQDAALMRDALIAASRHRLPVMDHAQDNGLVKGGVMHEGEISRLLGVGGMPPEAEELAVARDIALARLTGGHMHICHITTARSLEMVRAAKAEGVHVTAEVTPHHLMLTDEDAQTSGKSGTAAFNNDAKVNPPLRGRADTRALLRGLADGTIDAIATDHAPHAPEDKSGSPDEAAFGISGFETALAVVVTLCDGGVLTIERAIEALTTGPVRVLAGHGPKAGLVEGSAAEFVLFDPNVTWKVDASAFLSRGKNTPLNGRTLRGRVLTTFVNGAPAYWRDVLESRLTSGTPAAHPPQ